MPCKRTSRIYWKRGRAYADFRDSAEVGGKQEPLKAPDQPSATSDPDVAAKLVTDRLQEPERKRRN